jgi:hypothetical protein
MQVHINYSLHIAPLKKDDRVETHTIRSCPSFQGKPVFNDVLVKSEEGEWCGKVLMLFKFKLQRGESKVLGEGPQWESGQPKRCMLFLHPGALVSMYSPLQGCVNVLGVQVGAENESASCHGYRR